MSARTLRPRCVSTAASPAQKPQQLSSPPLTPKSGIKTKTTRLSKSTPTIKTETPIQARIPKSRSQQASPRTKVKENPDELPHNLGKRIRPTAPKPSADDAAPAKKPKRAAKTPDSDPSDVESKVIANTLTAEFAHSDAAQAEEFVKTPKKGKKNVAYGHIPGSTPFPGYARPTPEECHEVANLLASVHGKVSAPKTVQQGSLTVAGCGEVPHVLEALIRTRLSANTNNENSNRAFQGIVRTYGTVTDRQGRTMVDWNAVRLAPQSKLKTAIEKGGLANVKSGDIKRILDMVYDENQQRRTELLSKDTEAPGENVETEQEKQHEIERAEDQLLSLDHLHLLPQEDVFTKLISFPGIGAKTASCVLLFCLQRPSFAVDTHVWRLCSWLGWIPKNATRDQTFSHCEVRIPDDLKYPLHYLLIKHGKQCPKCQAKANKGKQDPELGDDCVIEHLVKRFNHKAGATRKVKKTTTKSNARTRKASIDDDESEASELSDVGSD